MRFTTPFLLLVAAVGLFFLFINPHYKTLTDLRAISAEYDDSIERAQSAVAKKDQLLAKKNAFDPVEIKRLQKMLPDKVDAVRLIIEINSITNARGTSIKNIKTTSEVATKRTTPGQDQTKYGTTQLSYSVSMTYDAFLQYMQDLEKSLRLVDITAVTFKPTDTSSIYDYSITLKTYWLK